MALAAAASLWNVTHCPSPCHASRAVTAGLTAPTLPFDCLWDLRACCTCIDQPDGPQPPTQPRTFSSLLRANVTPGDFNSHCIPREGVSAFLSPAQHRLGLQGSPSRRQTPAQCIGTREGRGLDTRGCGCRRIWGVPSGWVLPPPDLQARIREHICLR